MSRALRDSLLIDNLIYSFSSTPHNGILIKSFVMPGPDDELKYLAHSLEEWKIGTEARTFIDLNFKQKDFFNNLSRNRVY